LMVGGVMRLPVGESGICWASAVALIVARIKIDLMLTYLYSSWCLFSRRAG
jgi:hypothetical protein